jgi:serine/threonine protein kinase
VNHRTGLLTVGQKFQKYRIVGPIGEGGHARVYHAVQEYLDRQVAIKILQKHTPELRRRAQREARVLLRLKHPNVVEVIDAGVTDDDYTFMVMELLRGRTLRAALNEFAVLDIAEALRLFIQIADAIQVAHAGGVIHRDLKPLNVFIIEDNVVKVLDFGVAMVLDEVGITTQKHLVPGTPLYMAPEQLEGYGATFATDVFAVGIMFYEALTGRHPFNLDNVPLTQAEAIGRQLSRELTPANIVDSLIPGDVAAIAEWAMQRLPPKRPTAELLGRALREALTRIEATGGTRAPRPLWLNGPVEAFESWDLLSTGGSKAFANNPRTEDHPGSPVEANTTVPDFRLPVSEEPTDDQFHPSAELIAASMRTDAIVHQQHGGRSDFGGTLPGVGQTLPASASRSSMLTEEVMLSAQTDASTGTSPPSGMARGNSALSGRGEFTLGYSSSPAVSIVQFEREPRTPISGTHVRVDRRAPPVIVELPAPEARSSAPRRLTAVQRKLLRSAALNGMLFGAALGGTVGIAVVALKGPRPHHADPPRAVASQRPEERPRPPALDPLDRGTPEAVSPVPREDHAISLPSHAPPASVAPPVAAPPKRARTSKPKSSAPDVHEERLRWFEGDMNQARESKEWW